MKLDVLHIISHSISDVIRHITSSNLMQAAIFVFIFFLLSLFMYCNSPLPRRFKVYAPCTLHLLYILLSLVLLRFLTVVHMSLAPFESKNREKVKDRNINFILNVECMWTYTANNIPKFIVSLNYKILNLVFPVSTRDFLFLLWLRQ